MDNQQSKIPSNASSAFIIDASSSVDIECFFFCDVRSNYKERNGTINLSLISVYPYNGTE
jgi:hypothetical protein